MLRVMLAVFKLMGTAKERRVTILIALDAAPLTKTLSVFIVSTIISDPNDIDPKTGKTNSEFFRLLPVPCQPFYPRKKTISESHLSCIPDYWERDGR
jgi:hypothetical protein